MGKQVPETLDVNIRAIVIFTIGLFGLVIGSLIAMALLFGFFAQREKVSAEVVHAIPQPPAPRLQTSALLDRRAVLDTQEEVLATYGWVDQEKKVVHIPIQEAMSRMLKKGYPTHEK